MSGQLSIRSSWLESSELAIADLLLDRFRGQECPRHTILPLNVRRRIKHLHADSMTSTKTQRVARGLNNFHAASTTYTKIQRLSSKIIKNAIRGDLALWKSFDDPEAGSPCRNRTTGSPAALASILLQQAARDEACLRTRFLRVYL